MIVKVFRFGSTRFLATVIVGVCATISVTAWSLNSRFAQSEQTKEKIIEKAFTRNEVVEFSEIKVSQKAVEPGKAFDADDDWLNTIVVKVKNISDKPIVYLSVSFDFPETKATGAVMSYPVIFGQRPGSKFPQHHDPMFMMPGDTLEIPLEQHYPKMKSFVEHRHRITDVHKLELDIGFVIFADKTCWAAGNFCRQDPNDPDHYINTGDKPEPN